MADPKYLKKWIFFATLLTFCRTYNDQDQEKLYKNYSCPRGYHFTPGSWRLGNSHYYYSYNDWAVVSGHCNSNKSWCDDYDINVEECTSCSVFADMETDVYQGNFCKPKLWTDLCIVLGVFAIVSLVIGVCICCYCKYKKKKKAEECADGQEEVDGNYIDNDFEKQKLIGDEDEIMKKSKNVQDPEGNNVRFTGAGQEKDPQNLK